MTENKKEISGYQYIQFGHRLWRMRESRGVSARQMSEVLGITLSEYKKFERGDELPNPQFMLKIAKQLKVELAKLLQWSEFSKRNLEEHPLKGALKYSELLDEAIDRVKKSYFKHYDHEIEDEARKRLAMLKKDLCQTFILPPLPMNLTLILDAIDKSNSQVKYLHEVTNFVLEGESLAGFVARDLVLGPFIFFAANHHYFSKNPSFDIMDCFNRLTLEQFKELIAIAVSKSGLYATEEEIPILQQIMEFTGMTTLAVRLLEKAFPKNVNFHHLYMATLTQGIGTYLLFTLIEPSLRGRGEIEDANEMENRISQNLFNIIVYELHPVLSAMLAANWNFPTEVLDVLATHHDPETRTASPICAALKIVNTMIDRDFSSFNEEDLAVFFKSFPQIPLSHEAVLDVSKKLKSFKDNLFEKSSSILAETSKEIAECTLAQSTQSNADKRKAAAINYYNFEPNPSDFRFDPAYQRALTNECFAKLFEFKKDLFNIRTNEGLSDYKDRMGVLQVRMAYTSLHDLKILAEKFKVSVDEIRITLETP